jgi:hypothetical protein
MRTLVMAAAMLALAVLPAQAQMGGKRHQNGGAPAAQKRPDVDEKAYKAALEKIPEPKEKYDPWGAARPTDAAKKKQ